MCYHYYYYYSIFLKCYFVQIFLTCNFLLTVSLESLWMICFEIFMNVAFRHQRLFNQHLIKNITFQKAFHCNLLPTLSMKNWFKIFSLLLFCYCKFNITYRLYILILYFYELISLKAIQLIVTLHNFLSIFRKPWVSYGRGCVLL